MCFITKRLNERTEKEVKKTEQSSLWNNFWNFTKYFMK